MGCSSSDSDCELCSRSFFPEASILCSSNSNRASSCGASWVKPGDVKLKYRIGRGQFGDVWLGSLDSVMLERRQIAVKTLPAVGKEMIETLLRRFDSVFYSCQGLEGINNLLGISVKNGKVCILSTLYEGSVGGRMAHLPGNKLPLADALRFATEAARGVIELHSRGILSLNLKPCNLLLDGQDQIAVGDYGIPLIFSGCSSSDQKFLLGTPNYMAPEQWDVETRGPLTYETDSWGFGCSIVEMITGKTPWEGCSPQEIYDMVVLKGGKPGIPCDVPLAVERVLEGCFESDYRNRPDFCDILAALTSPSSVLKQGDWVYVYHLEGEASAAMVPAEKLPKIGLVKSEQHGDDDDRSGIIVQLSSKHKEIHQQESRRLRVWKDPLRVGDNVKVKQSARTCYWHYAPHEAQGVVLEVDRDEIKIRVKFCSSREVWEGRPEELEPVSLGFAAGDWVHHLAHSDDHHDPDGDLEDSRSRQQEEQQRPSCVGIVHRVQHDGDLEVAFVGHDTLWTGSPAGLAKVRPLSVGQLVKLRKSCRSPRFDWPWKQQQDQMGRVCSIMPNGCLVLEFPGRPWRNSRWSADPADVEIVQQSGSSLSSLIMARNWASNPVVFALGFLAGALVGNTILRSNAAASASAAAAAAASGLKDANLPDSWEGFNDKTDPIREGQPGLGSCSSSWVPSIFTDAFNLMLTHLPDDNDALL